MSDARKDDDDSMMAEHIRPAERGMSGSALAEALAARDGAAWRQVFDEEHDRIYRYAWLRTGNVADAEDIAAATFAEAVRSIGRFQYRGAPIAAWLFGIAHHETVDLLKRRRRGQHEALHDALAAPGDDARAADERRDVGEALGKLRPGQREVIVLRLVEGLSVAETAQALGKSEGAVKVTQMRALQAVRRTLGIERRSGGKPLD